MKTMFDDNQLKKEAETIAMMVPTRNKDEVLLRRRVMVLTYDLLLYIRDSYEEHLTELRDAPRVMEER